MKLFLYNIGMCLPESKFFSNFLLFLILMFNLTPTLDQNVQFNI